MNKTYLEKLKDPRWQRKRLEVLDRAEFRCEVCMDSEATLHVHHKAYFKGREPWEYDADQLSAICENCHAEHHDTEEPYVLAGSYLPVDGPGSRGDAAALALGFGASVGNENKVLKKLAWDDSDWAARLVGIGNVAGTIYLYTSREWIDFSDLAYAIYCDPDGFRSLARTFAEKTTAKQGTEA